jgi:lysylphosphatidylglycerol synthetase-like protein (DUF2156 family)
MDGQMARIIGAVLAGYVAVGVLVILTDLIFAAVVPGFRAMTPPPLYYFVTLTFSNTLYSIAGGYLCAAIARASIHKATLGLMIFGEIMGVVAIVLSWHTEPHWYAFALLVLFPLAVWIGSRLRSGSTERTLVSGAV